MTTASTRQLTRSSFGAHKRALADLPADAEVDLHQLCRSCVHLRRDASYLQGILGIDLTYAGFHPQLIFLTYALMQIPGGMLADRFKPRAAIAVATLGWGFFQAVAAVSLSAWVPVLTRLGLGASEAPIYPAAEL